MTALTVITRLLGYGWVAAPRNAYVCSSQSRERQEAECVFKDWLGRQP